MSGKKSNLHYILRWSRTLYLLQSVFSLCRFMMCKIQRHQQPTIFAAFWAMQWATHYSARTFVAIGASNNEPLYYPVQQYCVCEVLKKSSNVFFEKTQMLFGVATHQSSSKTCLSADTYMRCWRKKPSTPTPPLPNLWWGSEQVFFSCFDDWKPHWNHRSFHNI
jgi:hypothetical protein